MHNLLLRLRVSVVPTHLIAVRLLLDIGKKFLHEFLNWNSPLKICALYIRIIRTMGQGQSERNIEIALTACLWRSSIQLILEILPRNREESVAAQPICISNQ